MKMFNPSLCFDVSRCLGLGKLPKKEDICQRCSQLVEKTNDN